MYENEIFVFWRVYSSAWTRSSPLQQWPKRAIHPEVCHGKRAQGAEDLADAMQQILVDKKSFLASMDFSQAFDHMNPLITSIGLSGSGFPPPIGFAPEECLGRFN
jgi:hypothetical protein